MLTLSQQLKKLKVIVSGTPADYEIKGNAQKARGDMLSAYAENAPNLTDVSAGIPYDAATMRKLFPLLQQRRTSAGTYRPENVAEFIQRTGFIFTRADIETCSREELSERVASAVQRAREQSPYLDAQTLAKIEGLIGAGESFTQFMNRTKLPLSYLRLHSREEIADAIFVNLQNQILYR
jgi:hypothetical protein